MKIAIVGAGAIGGWLGVRLARSGQRVAVLAREKTLEAIKQRGLRLTENGETHRVNIAASSRAAELGKQDLVIVAVKGPALCEAAKPIGEMLDDETVVLPAMNGVPWWFTEGMAGPLSGVSLRSIDADGRIAAAIPARCVVGCVVHASCSTSSPGEIVHGKGNLLIVGEPRGAPTKRTEKVVGTLRQAGFDIEVSSHIQKDVWFKLWGNMTMNPISALTGAFTDAILDDELVRTFALSVMAEAAEIGRRIGCPIAESGEDRMNVTRKLGGIKTSMLQDVEAGRPLEIDALLAAPREIGRLVGVATPRMDALHGLVRLFAASRNRASTGSGSTNRSVR